MRPVQWLLLCVLFTLYLLFGGSVFMYFEQHREIEKKEEISVLRKDIKEILLLLDRDFYHNDTTREMVQALTSAKMGVIHRISSVCDVGDLMPSSESLDNGGDSSSTTTSSTTEAPGHAVDEDEEEDKLKWNFYNSVFFAFTVLTTIGYGHLAPSTSWSKYFLLVYALIGIPLTSLLLSGLGDYFSSRFVKVHKKSKEKPEKVTLFLEIMFYLVPGIIVFIVIPAIIFTFLEKWSFLDSIYYAFVTLTTIGFGDFVAGMGRGHTAWLYIYKSFIIIWITFGLGYLIMILGFISKGLTHKRVRVVIEKRLNTIRFTKEKLSKDIDYMRRVVNELYLMKIKPVYDDEGESDDSDIDEKDKMQKSFEHLKRRFSSYPQLQNAVHDQSLVKFSLGEEEGERRRKLTRRASDSDLRHADRDKSFEAAIRNQVAVDELLVTVVNALSGGMMTEVMTAVEELNVYEQEVMMEDPDVNLDAVLHHNHPHLNQSLPSRPSISLEESPASLRERRETSEDFPHWDLGALSESDEELITEGADLEQIVVHGEAVKTGSKIVEKVSGAIRKISSGSKNSEGSNSRKVSRNESFRRKISRQDTSERKLRQLPHVHSSPHPNQRKISEESRISTISGTSTKTRLTDVNLPSNGYGSNSSSRKVSPHPKISYESNSLAELLHALDSVHSKLHSRSSVSVSSIESSASVLEPLPTIPRMTVNRRSSRSQGAFNSGRRRKNGIIHPNFAFVNSSYVKDEGEDEEEDGFEEENDDRL